MKLSDTLMTIWWADMITVDVRITSDNRVIIEGKEIVTHGVTMQLILNTIKSNVVKDEDIVIVITNNKKSWIKTIKIYPHHVELILKYGEEIVEGLTDEEDPYIFILRTHHNLIKTHGNPGEYSSAWRRSGGNKDEITKMD